MRELRALFQQIGRRSSQRNEPQNIWASTYFRDLDEYVEEDNIRLQEVVRNTNRDCQYNVPFRSKTPRRDRTLLYTLLDEMNFHVSIVKQIIFVHKEYGMFEISLCDADVSFIPSHCLGCNLNCSNKKRHICIVLDNSSQPGWDNIGLAHIDLLLLSKVIALENDLIPIHVKNQINRSFFCSPPRSTSPETILGLRDRMLEELHRLRSIMRGEDDDTFIPYPPLNALIPPTRVRNLTTRGAIMLELRTLFRRHRHQPA